MFIFLTSRVAKNRASRTKIAQFRSDSPVIVGSFFNHRLSPFVATVVAGILYADEIVKQWLVLELSSKMA
ncbi:hypothetical protein QL285_055950 [Trifolium repens]|jgi:hypothetical protein|nr:hypothetical protein QL285_055950 [Trifolium repens]